MICSLDVDHSGSRLLAGSWDYSLRMFDFNGMKSDMRSFRSIEPSDGHPVHAVSLSPTGQPLLHLPCFSDVLFVKSICTALLSWNSLKPRRSATVASAMFQ